MGHEAKPPKFAEAITVICCMFIALLLIILYGCTSTIAVDRVSKDHVVITSKGFLANKSQGSLAADGTVTWNNMDELPAEEMIQWVGDVIENTAENVQPIVPIGDNNDDDTVTVEESAGSD